MAPQEMHELLTDCSLIRPAVSSASYLQAVPLQRCSSAEEVSSFFSPDLWNNV